MHVKTCLRAQSRAIRAASVVLVMPAVVLSLSSVATMAQLQSQAKPELVLQTGHTSSINAIALNPDGRFLVSGSSDNTLKLWDTATGNVLRTFFGHEKPVFGVAISGDSRLIASGGEDGGVRVWDVVTGDARTFGAHSSPIKNLAFSADSKQLTSLGSAELKLWDVASGREIRSTPLTTEKNTVAAVTGQVDQTAMALTLDGRLGAIGGGLTYQRGVFGFGGGAKGKPIRVIETATGREVDAFKLKGETPLPTDLRFSPDGRLLAAKFVADSLRSKNDAAQSSLTVYEVATGRELETFLSGDPYGTGGIAFSPDSRILASRIGLGAGAAPTEPTDLSQMAQYTAGSIKLFDVGTWREIRELTKTGFDVPSILERGLAATPLCFSGDGKLLAASLGDGIALFETSSGSRARVLRTTERAAAISAPPSGQPSREDMMRQMGLDQDVFRQMQGALGISSGLADAASKLSIGSDSLINFSPDGKLLSLSGSRSSTVWDVTAGIPRVRSQSADRPVPAIASPDAAFGRDFKPDRNALLGLGSGSRLSPDGRFSVALVMESPGGGNPLIPNIGAFGIGRKGSGSGDLPTQPYRIRVTDIATGRRLWEIKGESESMMQAPSFIFSPNGAVLAITSLEKKQPVINLYDLASGRKISSLTAGDRRIGAMNFSRDSKRLAITYGGGALARLAMSPRSSRAGGENLVTIHDLSNGRPLFTLTHDTPVSGVDFSPTGKLIATVGQDRNQYLWDAQTGEKLGTLVNLDVLGNDGGTEWLVVTPDGLFDGSPGAWQQIMWRFSQNTFDVGPVEIFFNELYYPGLAGEIFSGNRPKAPRDLQQIDRRQPTVTFNQPGGSEVTARMLTVKIDVAEAPADAAHPQSSGARDVRLFRNGTLVKLWRGDVLNGQSRATLEATLPVVAGENRLTAYAFNRENVKSADAFSTVTGSASLARKGTAYVLAFGVNNYENPQYDLKFAAADATAFAAEVKAQQVKLSRFERVEVIELLNKDATKDNLLLALRRLASTVPLTAAAPAALTKLERAQPEDAVIIYFAGHGTAKGARFYLVPHDLGYAGSRVGIDARAVETILAHSVSDLELESAVEGLDAGEMVLVIDACNSGQALEAEEKRRGPMNSKGLAQLAYEKGVYILTAAQSYQAALETSQLGHGYLTFALVEEGLKTDVADRTQKDGQVSVREWFDYATERVPEMQQNNSDTRLLLQEDDNVKDPNRVRNLQRPRAFYRREAEVIPVIIGKP